MRHEPVRASLFAQQKKTEQGMSALSLCCANGLGRSLLPASGVAQLADATIKILILALFGCISAFLAHCREVLGTVFHLVGRTALARNGAVVLAAALLFQHRAAFFADLPVVVLAVLLANRVPPFAIRLRGCGGRYGGGSLFAVWQHLPNPFP